MKKALGTFVLTVVMILSFSVQAYAGEIVEEGKSGKETPIKIDGDYSDWSDDKEMPTIVDGPDIHIVNDNKEYVQNIQKGQDLNQVKYYKDDDYLYLYMDRKESSSEWDIWIPIGNGALNGNKDSSAGDPFFFPVDNQGKAPYEWSNSYCKAFHVRVDYQVNENVMRYKILYNNNEVDNITVIPSSDGKQVEMRLPLKAVGLNGPNKTIYFNVACGISQSPVNIDWINHGKGISVDNGPVFGDLTPVLTAAGFLGVGFLVNKKKK